MSTNAFYTVYETSRTNADTVTFASDYSSTVDTTGVIFFPSATTDDILDFNETLSDFDNVTDSTLIVASKVLPEYPSAFLGFTAACAFIIAILGTVGNLLTILALPLSKKLRNTNTAFVVNLAVAELCYCAFILPVNGAQFAYMQYQGRSFLYDSICRFLATARYTFTQVELQTIVAIALMRAIAVGCPTFYQKMNTRILAGSYISFIWVYSLVLRLPITAGVFGQYVFNNRTLKCDLGGDPVSKFARFIALIIEAVIPIFLIIILYAFIFIMVRRSSTKVTSMSRKLAKSSKSSASSSSAVTSDEATGGDENAAPGTPRRRGSSTSSFKSIKKMVSDSNLVSRFARRSSSITLCMATNRRDMRVARSIFIIFLMLIVCSVPVTWVHIIDSSVTQPRRFLAVHILYWMQYWLNGVVYVLMNRQYRDAYVDFLAKFLPSWERHKGFTFPWETPSTTQPPVQLAGSFRSKKDTNSGHTQVTSQDPAGSSRNRGSPRASVPAGTPGRSGRLSAIIEVNTSSIVSDEEVFPKPNENMKNLENIKTEDGKEIKDENENQLTSVPAANDNYKSDEEKDVNDENEKLLSEGDVPKENEQKNSKAGYKTFDENTTDDDKEKWLNQNGSLETKPSLGDCV